MIGSITPLVQVAKAKWAAAVAAYSVASMFVTALIGATLGLIGSIELVRSIMTPAILIAASLSAAHELGLVTLPLPSHSRQTCQMWAYRYGPVVSAGLWGADLALCVSTRVFFSSLWLVLLLGVAAGGPTQGAIVVGGYGLGRCLLVSSGPTLLRWLDNHGAVNAALAGRPVWRRLHGVASALVAMTVAAMLIPWP